MYVYVYEYHDATAGHDTTCMTLDTDLCKCDEKPYLRLRRGRIGRMHYAHNKAIG
jgi:hypothetical protein